MPETELVWIKARASVGNGACVEMAVDDDGSMLVRHSAQPDVVIRYSQTEILAFFRGVRNHEFDHLLHH